MELKKKYLETTNEQLFFYPDEYGQIRRFKVVIDYRKVNDTYLRINSKWTDKIIHKYEKRESL